MWKIDPKDKHIHKNKHDHIQTHMWSMFVIVELLYGIRGRRERKESINSIIKHNICEGRWYKGMY
jgi:hypothetical protein